MSDWATIVSAVITGTATIAAILIAWCLTKRGLYNYQKLQDLKKTEMRLVRNVLETKSKFNESIALFYVSLQTNDSNSIQQDFETALKFFNSFSDFNLLLEEIKIELTMSSEIHKKYNKRMSEIIFGIMQTTSSEVDANLYEKLNPYFDLITSIFKDLIQYIHTKISQKRSELNK